MAASCAFAAGSYSPVVFRLLIGRQVELPIELLKRYPELSRARYRRGGVPPRIGGWFLAQPTVAAITLWSTVWLAESTRFDPELLLHELRHVAQFEASRAFPILYIWESLRRGYLANRYEVDARAHAAARMHDAAKTNPDTE
jgi:hypothetical protein